MKLALLVENNFAGVGTCASMIHIACEELSTVLAEVTRILTLGVTLVASIQVGDTERFVPRKSASGRQF
jgi:hypothetical protein